MAHTSMRRLICGGCFKGQVEFEVSVETETRRVIILACSRECALMFTAPAITYADMMYPDDHPEWIKAVLSWESD